MPLTVICISADNQWYQLETKGASDFPGCLQVKINRLIALKYHTILYIDLETNIDLELRG